MRHCDLEPARRDQCSIARRCHQHITRVVARMYEQFADCREEASVMKEMCSGQSAVAEVVLKKCFSLV